MRALVLQRCWGAVASTSVAGLATRAGRRQGRPGQATRRDGGRGPRREGRRTLEDVVIPVKLSIRKDAGAADVGAEMAGALERKALARVLASFASKPSVRTAALEQGLSDKLFHKAFVEFRIFCQESSPLPPELHVKMADVLSERAPVEDVFPFFMEHSRRVFPHLECLEDLKSISDLTQPHSWYTSARAMQRKVVFHAGPTNSGKTHHALERFTAAKTGVYCGPLKLLASEVYHKTNALGVPCDMKTGDDRKYASGDKEAPANHVACTVEMLDTEAFFEVAVIDEIQMVRDVQRGWAWTRALLGVCADEVHVCGEPAAIDVVREILFPTGEDLDVKKYHRMTSLRLEDQALGSFDNVQDGDCIVCFNRRDIFNVSRKMEALGRQVAVIYGSLPPATKLAQASRFNDPADPCKVLIATDAIGMGLNLHIQRVIFYSLLKPQFVVDGKSGGMETQMEPLHVYEAKQIGGRAGRFGTAFEDGRVTTFRAEDLKLLRQIWDGRVEEVEAAGLRPTLEQVELFSFHLPQASLTNLLHIFISLVSVNDSAYFMCQMEDTLFLSNLIEHVPLPLRTRYTFCLAPVTNKKPKVCAIYLKFARRLSRSEPCTFNWFCADIGWPLKPPEKLADLMELESTFDMMELYLWFSYRFPDQFPDAGPMREIQTELDAIIQEGVSNIVSLMRATETTRSSGVSRALEAEGRSGSSGPGRRASEPLDVSELLSPSEIEAGLEEELERKEVNLVLELVRTALRESEAAGRVDLRGTAALLEALASELDQRKEQGARRSRLPTSGTLRRAVEDGLLSSADLVHLAQQYKTLRARLVRDHEQALLSASLRAQR